MWKIKIIVLICLLAVSCKENKKPNCNCVKFEFYDDYDELQLNLNIAFDDLGNINKCAKEMNKPILTIYGGFACVGDQKGIWRPMAAKKINTLLREEFLIRYYHVDNSERLPDSFKGKIDYNPNLPESYKDKPIKTLGNFFSAKQANYYQCNYQPLYTITDWKENDLSKPIGYTIPSEIEKFENFLIEGLKNYKKTK